MDETPICKTTCYAMAVKNCEIDNLRRELNRVNNHVLTLKRATDEQQLSIDELHAQLTKTRKTVLVRHRGEEYIAILDGHPEMWGCGTTQAEAVGDIIISHPEATNIQYEFVKQFPVVKS